MTGTQTRTETVTFGYRYRWQKNPTNATTSACWLERVSKKTSGSTFTQTQTGATTRPITWTDYQEFDKWNYDELSPAGGGLKVGTSGWASSVAIPRPHHDDRFIGVPLR